MRTTVPGANNILPGKGQAVQVDITPPLINTVSGREILQDGEQAWVLLEGSEARRGICQMLAGLVVEVAGSGRPLHPGHPPLVGGVWG